MKFKTINRLRYMKHRFATAKLVVLMLSMLVATQATWAQEKDTLSDDSLYDLELEALMDMDIMSASKKVESLFDSPLSSSVITKEELRNSGATSIAEALRLVPGFIIREKTNGNYDVHIRGYENIPPNDKVNYSDNSVTLVMIDNRIVYNYFQGGTFWETLPISIADIERIEVIRGPSSALYGPNAVTGVINILTTKQNEKGVSIFADVQAGNLNTKIATASVGVGVSEKFRMRFSGKYQYRERTQKEYYSYDYQRWTTVDSLNILEQPIHQYTTDSVPILDNPSEYYPDPVLGSDLYAANAFLYFDPTEDIQLEAQFGMQDSKVQTFYVDQGDLPMSNRESNSTYGSLFASLFDLKMRASYQMGEQYLFKGEPNFHYDYNMLDANVEYDLQLKNLTIRPGVSFQQSFYDSSPYSDETTGSGLFQGEKELSNFSFHLRSEYTFDKLRLIAALRGDKYTKPSDIYYSWQFVALHKIDDSNTIRFVYSRANRGPFMLDTYSNLTVPIDDGLNMYLNGNEELNLLTMDQFEVGFRNKILPNLYSDFEVFYSTTKDYAAAKFDSITFGPTTNLYFKYYNLPLSGAQFGFTGSLDYRPSSKFWVKFFATVQRTILNDYPVSAHADTLMIAYDNKSTPVVFGGLIANYSPFEKLNIFGNLYYYSQQSYDFLEVQNIGIQEKLRLDMKVSYNVWKDCAIYLNARNVLNNETREFPFGDKTSGLYMVGLQLAF